DMVDTAKQRVNAMHEKGLTEARLYGADPNDGVGGIGSVFLLLDDPEVYGLPPDPQVPTKDLPEMYKKGGIAAAGMLAAAATAFMGARKKYRCVNSTLTGHLLNRAVKRNGGTAHPVPADDTEAETEVVKCRWSMTLSSTPPIMGGQSLNHRHGMTKLPPISFLAV